MRLARHAGTAIDLGLGKRDQILAPFRRLETKIGERIVLAYAIAKRVSPHRARRACRAPRPRVRPGARRWAINGREPEAADVAEDLFDCVAIGAPRRGGWARVPLRQICAHYSTVIDEADTG